MREKRFAYQILLVIFTILCPYWGLCHAGADELSPAQKKALICGPNATLLFLTMCRVDVCAAELAEMHAHEQGASLSEIRDTCLRLGLETQVLRFDICDASKVRLPAIAHSDNGATDHYYVWFDVDEHSVLALDATTGEKLKLRRERLADFWSGYALVPATFTGSQLWLSAASRRSLEHYAWLLVTLSCIVIGVRYWKGTLHPLPIKTLLALRAVAKRSLLGGLLMAANLVPLLSAAQQPGDEGGRELVESPWRDAEHGGQNCLYLFLRLTGKEVSYSSLTDTSGRPPQSLDELGRIARVHDSLASVRQLKPVDLALVKLPAIMHLDGDDPLQGCFVLLLQKQDHGLVFMNGPSATINSMTREEFFRRWSGYGVIHASNSHRVWSATMLGSLSVIMIVVSFTLNGRKVHV